jgi:hypothetical protein
MIIFISHYTPYKASEVEAASLNNIRINNVTFIVQLFNEDPVPLVLWPQLGSVCRLMMWSIGGMMTDREPGKNLPSHRYFVCYKSHKEYCWIEQ